MIIYVESNFILELALEQEQCQSCEEILKICESGNGSLVVPAFCIAETYQTLRRRANERRQFGKLLGDELTLLGRTKSYNKDINTLQDVTSILAKSIEEEIKRFDQVLNERFNKAELILLEQTIITDAIKSESQFNLKPADAIVYASILQHLMKTEIDHKCFLNKDRKGFGDSDIVAELGTYNCKIFFSFDDGFNYIQHQIQPKMPA